MGGSTEKGEREIDIDPIKRPYMIYSLLPHKKTVGYVTYSVPMNLQVGDRRLVGSLGIAGLALGLRHTANPCLTRRLPLLEP